MAEDSESATGPDSGQQRGTHTQLSHYGDLLDGFVPFVTPTTNDYVEVLRNGLVVLDTNALLNLYRYHQDARDDLFAILEAFNDRLFVPHQVASEFWNNREATIRSAANAASDLGDDLARQGTRAAESLTEWAERSGLPSQRLEKLQSAIKKAFSNVTYQVVSFGAFGIQLDAIDTTADPVLARLIGISDSKVGAPYSSEQRAEHEREAQRRIDAEEPPGYKDRAKGNSRAFGDYFVWRELLDEARRRQLDVLLVTGDLKEDWWRKESGQTRGPRIELSIECLRETGQRLFMTRPSGLLARAEDALHLKIRRASVEAAERVDRYAYDRERRQYYAAADLYPIVKFTESSRGGYLETLIDMTTLAETSPPYDEFISSFQRVFPKITRIDEARRRIGILPNLDLVSIHNDRVTLTECGRRLLTEQRIDLVQDQFLSRIAGAAEVRERAATTPIHALRSELQDNPPVGTSPTQALLLLQWLEGLELT